jgi:hypothetical protein
MSTYARFLSKIEIEPGIFEIIHQVFHSGACQCYKNCDCYDKRGEFLWNDVRYSYGLINEFGKEKTFNSLKGCKDSYNSYLNKQIINSK